MSDARIVRNRLRLHERSRRTVDQRVLLRFPRLAAAFARLVARRQPASRFRQAAPCRAVRLGVEAFNRRDFDLVLLGSHPDFEFLPARELVEAGLAEPCYRGPARYREFVTEWSEIWGADFRFEALELIDLGDRLVALADVPMRAQTSGVPFTGNYAAVITLDRGRSIRQQDYWAHDEALEAAGLRV